MASEKTFINKKNKISKLIQDNKLHAARDLCDKYCKRLDNDADLWYLRGIIDGRMNDFKRAKKCFQKAIKRRYEHVKAHDSLGRAFYFLGEYDDAVLSFQNAISLDESYTSARYHLCCLLKERGDTGSAIGCYKKLLELVPEMPEACMDLGHILLEQKNYIEAEVYFKICYKTDPQAALTNFCLARIYFEKGNFVAAEKFVLNSIKENEENIEANTLYANVLFNLGKLSDAKRVFKKILSINSKLSGAIAGIAAIHEMEGEYERAFELLEPLLNEDELHPEVAVTYAKLCRHTSRELEAISKLKSILERSDLELIHRTQILFNLGKLCDDSKSYDAAFECIKGANELLKKDFDQEINCIVADNIITEYQALNTDSIKAEGLNSKVKLVFIIGMPRSGTSLVEQILSAHPDVFAGGERDDIHNIVNSLPDMTGAGTSYPQGIKQLSTERVSELRSKHMELMKTLLCGEKCITNKMPHNFLYLGLISILFPDAVIIHCSRNALDTCLSCYFQDFGPHHTYTRDLDDLALYYSEYRRLMEYWNSKLRLQILNINYEDLVEDNKAITVKMLEACGLDWNDACLDYFNNKRLVNTASYNQVRKPIYNSSVDRWKNYEEYLGELITKLSGYIAA